MHSLILLLWVSVFHTAIGQNGFLRSASFSDSSMDEREETLLQATEGGLQQISSRRQNGQQSAHCNKIPDAEYENGDLMNIPGCQSLPPFPVFNRKAFIKDEYTTMLSANCKPSFNATTFHKRDAVELYCNASATATEINSITEEFRHSSRAVAVSMSGGETLSPRVLNPVHRNIVVLRIDHCPTQTTLSKLPALKLSSLMSLQVNGCENLIIKKSNFAYNKRLRLIMFMSSTIASIEKYTFMDLPQLAMLSLEWEIQPPFSQSQISHLQRFHCDCEYSWLRKWFKENPYILADKYKGEIVYVTGVHNIAIKQPNIFYAVDCEWSITRYTARVTQSTYSVNTEC